MPNKIILLDDDYVEIEKLSIKINALLAVFRSYAENNMSTNGKIANIFTVLDGLYEDSRMLVHFAYSYIPSSTTENKKAPD